MKKNTFFFCRWWLWKERRQILVRSSAKFFFSFCFFSSMNLCVDTLERWKTFQEEREAFIFKENVKFDCTKEDVDFKTQNFINSFKELQVLDQGYIMENMLPNRSKCIALYSFIKTILPRLVQTQLSFCVPMVSVAEKGITSTRKKILFKDILDLCKIYQKKNHPFGSFLGSLSSSSFKSMKSNFNSEEENLDENGNGNGGGIDDHDDSEEKKKRPKKKKKKAQTMFLCFEASLEKLDDSEALNQNLDSFAISAKTYGVNLYIRGRWTLEEKPLKISNLTKTDIERKKIPGTGAFSNVYLVGKIPWPVNIPLPSILTQTTDFASIYHNLDLAGRMSNCMEVAVPAPFVCIKGVCWGLENREVQPEENPMLREWDEDDVAFSISTSSSSGSHTKSVDIVRLTKMGPTPLSMLKPGHVDARKFKSLFYTSSGRVLHKQKFNFSNLKSVRQKMSSLWEFNLGDKSTETFTRTAKTSEDQKSMQQQDEAETKKQSFIDKYKSDKYRKSVFYRNTNFKSSKINFHSRWMPYLVTEDEIRNLRPQKKHKSKASASKQNSKKNDAKLKLQKKRYKQYKKSCKLFEQEHQTLMSKVEHVASRLPVLTMRLYPGASFEVSLTLVFRAMGVCNENMFYNLVRGGDSDEDFALYKDLLRNSWHLHEGCTTREHALYIIGLTRCKEESLGALEQVAWQGQWWIMHNFLRRMHPIHWRDCASTSMADMLWMPYVGSKGSSLVLDYLGEEYCTELFRDEYSKMCLHIQNKKLVFLSQTARRLCRAEAGLPTLLTHRNGLTDKMVLHNRAVLSIDRLLAFNIAKGLQKSQEKLVKIVKELGSAACILDSNTCDLPSEFNNIVASFATQRDKAKRNNVPLQKVLQLFRGNVHQKMQISRRVAQVAKSSQGLTSDQKFCLSQLGFLDAAETSKSNKSGYDKRWAFYASCTHEMPFLVRNTLRDWIVKQPGVFEPHSLVQALYQERSIDNCYLIFFWSEVIGVIFKPNVYVDQLISNLQYLKRSPYHPDWYGLRYMSILKDPKERCISVFVSSGRHVAPVWNVNLRYNNILLPPKCRKIFESLVSPSTSKEKQTQKWAKLPNMISAVSTEDDCSKKSFVLSNFNFNLYAQKARKLWRLLVKNGSITFVSSQESSHSWCCETLSKFRHIQKQAATKPKISSDLNPATCFLLSKKKKQKNRQDFTCYLPPTCRTPSYVDLSPTRLYGLSSLLVVGAENVKGVRMVYGTSLMGACMSETLSTSPLDGTAYTLAQGQATLLQNKPTVNVNQIVPYAQNLMAAYRGWGSTQEDGWAFNRDVAKRGAFDYLTRKHVKTNKVFLHSSDVQSEKAFEWNLMVDKQPFSTLEKDSQNSKRAQSLVFNNYMLNKKLSSEYNSFHAAKKMMYRQNQNTSSLLTEKEEIFQIPKNGSFFDKGEPVLSCNFVDVAQEEERLFLAAERRNLYKHKLKQRTDSKKTSMETNIPLHLRLKTPTSGAETVKNNDKTRLADFLEKIEILDFLKDKGFATIFCSSKKERLIGLARNLFNRFSQELEKEENIFYGTNLEKKYGQYQHYVRSSMAGSLSKIDLCMVVKVRSLYDLKNREFNFFLSGKDEIENQLKEFNLIRSLVQEFLPSICMTIKCNLRYELLYLEKMNLGDKFCNRTGQKSTVCSFIPAYEMPRTCDGQLPAVLLGPSQMMRGTPNDVYNTLQNSYVIRNPSNKHCFNGNFKLAQPMSEQILEHTQVHKRMYQDKTHKTATKIMHKYLLESTSGLQIQHVFDAGVSKKINSILSVSPKPKPECLRLVTKCLKITLKQYMYFRFYDYFSHVFTLPTIQNLAKYTFKPFLKLWERLSDDAEFTHFLQKQKCSTLSAETGILTLMAFKLFYTLKNACTRTKTNVVQNNYHSFRQSDKEKEAFMFHLILNPNTFLALQESIRKFIREIFDAPSTQEDTKTTSLSTLLRIIPEIRIYENYTCQNYLKNFRQVEKDQKLEKEERKEKISSPKQKEEKVSTMWLRSMTRMLNPCFDMTLDSQENPTFAGTQSFLKNTKTALCQFKSRHTGPKDPSTHQGVKCSEIYGASRFGHMEIDAVTQAGAGKMLQQILESSDKKIVAVCLKCKGIGKINQKTGKTYCFNQKCLSTLQEDDAESTMKKVSTAHSFLKMITTLNGAGLTVKLT